MYVLDANVFISFNKSTHPIDIMPSFWEKLGKHAREHGFVLIDEVYDEIEIGGDDLSIWIEENESCFIRMPGIGSNANEYGEIIQGVNDQKILSKGRFEKRYTQGALEEFSDRSNADAFIISIAKHYGYTVVTNEKIAISSRKSVKIPDVCKTHGVRCINAIELLRKTNFKL